VPFTAGRTARLSLTQSNPSLSPDPIGIGSAPALAAAIRRTHKRMELPGSMRTLLRHNPVVPMYHIAPGSAVVNPALGRLAEATIPQSVQHEAQSAASTLMAIAERLRRLRSAYGAWRHFDASAYFDLTVPQSERLIQINERVTMVHVLFFADALLPSFQVAEAFWQEDFRPHYLELRSHLRNGNRPLEPVMAFADRSQPQMLDHWRRLVATIRATRALLNNEIGFWAANGSSEERARWRWAWVADPAPGIDAELLPALPQTPTLTLAVDFPLPTYRQPGRRRRLAERHERGLDRYRSGDY
jgi:hypothetical protein